MREMHFIILNWSASVIKLSDVSFQLKTIYWFLEIYWLFINDTDFWFDSLFKWDLLYHISFSFSLSLAKAFLVKISKIKVSLLAPNWNSQAFSFTLVLGLPSESKVVLSALHWNSQGFSFSLVLGLSSENIENHGTNFKILKMWLIHGCDLYTVI